MERCLAAVREQLATREAEYVSLRSQNLEMKEYGMALEQHLHGLMQYESAYAALNVKNSELQQTVQSMETLLAQSQTEKTELSTKLMEMDQRVACLQHENQRLQTASLLAPSPSASVPPSSSTSSASVFLFGNPLGLGPFPSSTSTTSSSTSSSASARQSSSSACYRCGRTNHYAGECYAATHIKGYRL